MIEWGVGAGKEEVREKGDTEEGEQGGGLLESNVPGVHRKVRSPSV